MKVTVEVELSDLEVEIMTLYNEGILIKDIIRQLGISQTKYATISKKLKELNLIGSRPRGARKWRSRIDHKNPKNYSYDRQSNSFNVYKSGTYFGRVKTRQQAEAFVELLKENDWDKSLAKVLRKEVMSV